MQPQFFYVIVYGVQNLFLKNAIKALKSSTFRRIIYFFLQPRAITTAAVKVMTQVCFFFLWYMHVTSPEEGGFIPSKTFDFCVL